MTMDFQSGDHVTVRERLPSGKDKAPWRGVIQGGPRKGVSLGSTEWTVVPDDPSSAGVNMYGKWVASEYITKDEAMITAKDVLGVCDGLDEGDVIPFPEPNAPDPIHHRH
jgi:hypothetical protein